MVSFRLLSLLLAAMAAPSLGAVHEHVKVPPGWSKVKDAAGDKEINLSVALSRQNMDQLESKLMALSTPGHDQYSQWMDVGDVESAFPVASDSGVKDWLHSHDITKFHRQGDLLHFQTTVHRANKLLDATFAWYSDGSTQKLRTTKYSVPNRLQGVVDLVSPTTYFGHTHEKPMAPHHPVPSHEVHKAADHKGGQVSEICKKVITPECIRELYQVGDYTPDPKSGSRIGYGNFLNQSSSESDLAQFEKIFGLPQEGFDVTLLNGGVNDQNPATEKDVEANLDLQTIVGLTHPLPVRAYITGGNA